MSLKNACKIMYDLNGFTGWIERNGKGMKKRTDEVLKLIASLDAEDQSYLNAYLENAPISILEQFDIVEMEGETTFIYEGEDIRKIFILVEGRVKATDQYLDGVSYEYMWFKPVKAFGVMELLMDLDHYKSTLTTAVDCRFLVISKDAFEKWLSHDEKMLRLEVRIMGNYLLTQAKMARAFLFLEGKQRVMVFLVAALELSSQSGMIRLSRQSIADNTGLSIRTVNRAIKELMKEGYITCQGMRILADEEQQQRMRQDTRECWKELDSWSRLL